MAPIAQAVLREQLGRSLVSQLTGVRADQEPDRFETLCNAVKKTLKDTKTATSPDMFQMDRKFFGLIEKAKVLVEDDLAAALDYSYGSLKEDVKNREVTETGIKMHSLPDHLQLLISLALPPAPSTHTYASIVLDKKNDPFRVPSALTWQTILAEEPFEGQHWEGASVPGAVDPPGIKRWSRRCIESLSSASASADEDDAECDSTQSSSRPTSAPGQIEPAAHRSYHEQLEAVLTGRRAIDQLLLRQHWRPEWRIDVDTDRPFDSSDPSTFSPSFTKASGASDPVAQRIAGEGREAYISETDAVREVLFALQGLDNVLIKVSQTNGIPQASVTSSAPRIMHLTVSSYQSILRFFAGACTVVCRLDSFAASVRRHHSPISTVSAPVQTSLPVPHTLEAFAEALDLAITEFRSWCSTTEQAFCRAQNGSEPPFVVSLLSLATDVQQAMFLLDVLAHIAETVQGDFHPKVGAFFDLPSTTVTLRILDSIFLAYDDRQKTGDVSVAAAILRVFTACVQPTWSQVSHWVQHGKSTHSPDSVTREDVVEHAENDFFIHRSTEVVLTDPSFWSFAYTIPSTAEGKPVIPSFLEHISQDILAGGKARALLSALGQLDDEVDGSLVLLASFSQLIVDDKLLSSANSSIGYGMAFPPLSDFLPSCPTSKEIDLIVQDRLLPLCEGAQNDLCRVLVDSCGLWGHLYAMEGLYLMHRGDVMDNFCDIIFDRMDARQPWNDFHYLNAVFRDVIASEKESWLDSSLVRFWYKASRDRQGLRSVKCFEALSVEYQVPFPLVYVFGPSSAQTYSNVFALLLQLRRAKRLIDRILIRNSSYVQSGNGQLRSTGELKAVYALRSKLSWFINAFTYFICTNVIHTQVQLLHSTLKSAVTLDEMIHLHSAHLERITSRCLLRDETLPLRRAVLAVLDMAVYFSDSYAALCGNTVPGLSRGYSVMGDRRRRKSKTRRRHRNKKGNFVGFVEAMPTEADSETSDDETPMFDETSVAEDSTSAMSLMDESVATRIDRMSNELDGLVRFIRRGIEGLASGISEASHTFAILSFILEDWDL